MKVKLTYTDVSTGDEQLITAALLVINETQFDVELDGKTYAVQLKPDAINAACGTALINHKNYPYAFSIQNQQLLLWVDGQVHQFNLPRQQAQRQQGSAAQSTANGNQIVSPMPGKVLQIKKKTGDTVVENETVVVMESMKMEMSLNAAVAGVIESVTVKADDMVEQNTVLVTIKPESE